MKISTSDPDLETLVGRITRKVLDLQPDFQRGEVWGTQKKIRLIDSILRGWHIPPIHIVSDLQSNKLEVLDGQQRLSAIRDFYNNKLEVNADIPPQSDEIESVGGKTFAQLPPAMQERFKQYSIRTLTISEHTPEEAGELFYRLNQPTNLTAAEQRNAFFGPARTQVKKIVRKFPQWNLSQETLGFGNSRMAYDDVVARACYYVDQGTLRQKVTAMSIATVYRSSSSFSSQTTNRIIGALRLLGSLMKSDEKLKLNKATLLTWALWLCDVTWCLEIDDEATLSDFIYAFERERARTKSLDELQDAEDQAFSVALLALFSDRASSRVADVSSVLTRHAVLWLEYLRFAKVSNDHLSDPGLLALSQQGSRIFRRRSPSSAEDQLSKITDRDDWGAL